MANHPAHGPSVSDDEVEAIKRLSDAVQICLGREQRLCTLTADLYAARLRGDGVQEELDALFDDDPELLTVARLANQGLLRKLLDDAVEHEFLNEDQCEAFEALWEEIGWVTAGVDAYNIACSDRPAHWTAKDIGIGTLDGQLVVEHSLAFGVDTVHDVQMPAWRFFTDAVQRLRYVSRLLPETIEDGDIDAEALAEILETQSDLADVVARLDDLEVRQLADDKATEEQGDPASTDTDDSSASTSADDPVPTGEDQAPEGNEDDTTGSASIGFQ